MNIISLRIWLLCHMFQWFYFLILSQLVCNIFKLHNEFLFDPITYLLVFNVLQNLIYLNMIILFLRVSLILLVYLILAIKILIFIQEIFLHIYIFNLIYLCQYCHLKLYMILNRFYFNHFIVNFSFYSIKHLKQELQHLLLMFLYTSKIQL